MGITRWELSRIELKNEFILFLGGTTVSTSASYWRKGLCYFTVGMCECLKPSRELFLLEYFAIQKPGNLQKVEIGCLGSGLDSVNRLTG